jgi:DNA-binding transcriptional regulator YiaG
MTNNEYRTRRLEALHKTAAASHGVGALNKATMRDLDAFCLARVEAMSGTEIPGVEQQLWTYSRQWKRLP